MFWISHNHLRLVQEWSCKMERHLEICLDHTSGRSILHGVCGKKMPQGSKCVRMPSRRPSRRSRKYRTSHAVNLEAAIQYVTVGQKIGAGLWCMALKRGLHLQKHVAKLVLHVRRDAWRASSTESCGFFPHARRRLLPRTFLLLLIPPCLLDLAFLSFLVLTVTPPRPTRPNLRTRPTWTVEPYHGLYDHRPVGQTHTVTPALPQR